MTLSLYQRLSQLDSDELRYKTANSLLTDEAHKTALEILSQRGEDVVQLPPVPIADAGLVEAYGVATKEERQISNRSFQNLVILFALPLAVLAIFGIGISIADKLGGFASLLLYTGCATLNFFLLKVGYDRLFKREDKLQFGSKVYFFIPAVSVFALMTALLIVGSLLKIFK
jgi:hypothetical protein